jgi:hypothetical protein
MPTFDHRLGSEKPNAVDADRCAQAYGGIDQVPDMTRKEGLPAVRAVY